MGQGVKPLRLYRTRQEALEEVGSWGRRVGAGGPGEPPAFRPHTPALHRARSGC